MSPVSDPLDFVGALNHNGLRACRHAFVAPATFGSCRLRKAPASLARLTPRSVPDGTTTGGGGCEQTPNVLYRRSDVLYQGHVRVGSRPQLSQALIVRAPHDRQAAWALTAAGDPALIFSGYATATICRQVEITNPSICKSMEENKDSQIKVKTTGSNVLGTHVVDEEPIAVLDRHTSAFARDLSQSLGQNESWTLDFIVETYARRFGFDYPG